MEGIDHSAIIMSAFGHIKNIAAVHMPILVRSELMRQFPSLYPRLHLKPSAAWINPTDNCIMRCIMCSQWRKTKTNELTLLEWKDVIRQLRDEGIKMIGLLGGEPLLSKDIVEIVRYVSELQMPSAMITSGFLLDDQKLEALINAGLKHITVSIDGIGEEY